MSDPVRFLGRWSRLKRAAQTPAPTPQSSDAPLSPVPDDATAPDPAPSPPRVSGASDGSADPALPPVETLNLDADFTGFLSEEVGESLRRAALRKLFADPHFNRMDGLDVYIDDYNIADPIPPDVMKRLRQFQTLLAEPGDETAQPELPQDDAPPAPATGEPSTPAPRESAFDGDRGATEDAEAEPPLDRGTRDR